MFNEVFYLTNSPDVKAAIAKGDYVNGQDHYNKCGKAEFNNGKGNPARRPYPQLPMDFVEGIYLKNNPDVLRAVVNGDYVCGAEHWIMYGWNEKQRKYK